jgi:hypothetical protein
MFDLWKLGDIVRISGAFLEQVAQWRTLEQCPTIAYMYATSGPLLPN